MEILISVLGHMFSAVPGIVSLYLYWKSKRPKIKAELIKGYYTVLRSSTYEKILTSLRIKLTLSIFNYSNRYISIKGILLQLRYSKKALNLLKVDNIPLALAEEPKEFVKIFPLELKPYGCKKIKASFTFRNVILFAIDRAQEGRFLGWLKEIPFFWCKVIEPEEKEKWERLPLLSLLTIATSEDLYFHYPIALYENTQEESKMLSGVISPFKKVELSKKFFENRWIK